MPCKGDEALNEAICREHSARRSIVNRTCLILKFSTLAIRVMLCNVWSQASHAQAGTVHCN